ncbi:MAG: hypothetical protein ACOYB2_10870 [Limnohabitans sp.]
MRAITVEVAGRPPTPNSRRDWHQTYRDNQIWKDRAWIAAMDALQRDLWPVQTTMLAGKRPEPRLIADKPMQFAALDVTIIVPDDRDRDLDNGIASLKPLIDGCVSARIVVDDSTRHLIEFRVRFVKQARVSKVLLRFDEQEQPGSLGL